MKLNLRILCRMKDHHMQYTITCTTFSHAYLNGKSEITGVKRVPGLKKINTAKKKTLNEQTNEHNQTSSSKAATKQQDNL
ncbi:hypothetical protein A4A49_24634 [Nicotiana attenuata]|uniref:Uncharacterized protein n=1 Tax=Nicotiana attenuata TaxID=49451 RepID=A0A314KJD2_NICAT|nr:hypothetical protein A4A49_24634 [Nicotiana attenuata]